MSVHLAYSYSTGLTKKEQTEIDNKTKKCRKKFSKAFVKVTSFSLAAYFLYSLTTSSVAHAENSNLSTAASKTAKDTGSIQPAPTSNVSKPGFKPLSEGTKSAYISVTSEICEAAAQSSNFYLGLACAFLLVVIIN